MAGLGLRAETLFRDGFGCLGGGCGFLGCGMRLGRGFYIDIEAGDNVVVQLDFDFVSAGFLDRTLEHDPMALDFQAAQFALEAIRDVLGGDGAEGLAGFPGFEGEGDLELVDAAGQFFGLV